MIIELTEQEARDIEKRRKSLLERACVAGKLLLDLGAKRVWIFGSILQPECFHEHSDVDIAVEGLPVKHIYAVEGKIEDILGTDAFDLVYMETAREYIKEKILRYGSPIT